MKPCETEQLVCLGNRMRYLLPLVEKTGDYTGQVGLEIRNIAARIVRMFPEDQGAAPIDTDACATCAVRSKCSRRSQDSDPQADRELRLLTRALWVWFVSIGLMLGCMAGFICAAMRSLLTWENATARAATSFGAIYFVTFFIAQAIEMSARRHAKEKVNE